MTDDEIEVEVEETVMLTRRDRRRSAAIVQSPLPPNAEALSDTRDAAADAGDADAAADSVDADAAENGADPDDDADADVVDEATVVVDRRSAAAEEPGTDREGDPLDESTVLVSRTPRRVRRKRSEQSEDQGDSSADRTDAAAPVSFAAPTGAPAPEIYRPRPAPLGPSAPPVVIGATAPTRTVDAGLLSVAKQGLRWSRATLLAVGAACVVSVAGLVALGLFVFV